MADKNKPDKLEIPEPQVSDELAATTKPDPPDLCPRPDGSRLDPLHTRRGMTL